MRILAVTLDRRYALMPSVPTVSESVPAFRKPPTWFAMFAPAAVPRAALVRFHASLAKALSAPELKPRFDEEGLLVVGNTPDEFAAGLKLDMQVHQRAMDAAGLKPE